MTRYTPFPRPMLLRAALRESAIMASFAQRSKQMMDVHPITPGNTDEKFQKGLEQFNRRLFFEAHETWEEIWLPSLEPERTFLQGIIQVAAGFHHYARSNRAGARSLLGAGLNKLDRFPETHHGLELESLRVAARLWIAELSAGNDPGPSQFPKIERTRDENC